MSIGRNSMYNMMGSVVPLIIALVTVPLYLSAVGIERYGALAIAWLILGYFGLFDLGMGRATSQRIAALVDSDAAHRSRVFWTAVIVNIGMGIAGGIILYFGATYFFEKQFSADDWLRTEILAAIPYLSMAVPIATLTGVANGALQAREKFLDLNIITIIGTSLFQILPLSIAYIVGPTLKWLIIAAITARIIGFLIFYTRVHHHILRGFRPKFDRSEWLALLKFGGWVTITAIISPILVVSDRIMIGSLIGAAAVAIYTIPFDIVQRVSVLPGAVAAALFPRMVTLNQSDSIAISSRAVKIINTLISPIILAAIYFINPLLELWIGPEIASQASILVGALLFGWWINAYAIIPYSQIQAHGKPNIVALAHLFEAPFYIMFLLFALEKFGLFGASLAFALRTTLDYVILSRFANGYWHTPRSLILIGIIYIISIAVNIYFKIFSVPWLISLIMSITAVAVILLRIIPVELKPYAQKIIPKTILEKLTFG